MRSRILGRRRAALYLSAAAGVMSLAVAAAAEAQTTEIDEVTVTATRRGDVKVIDTPLAVTAVGGETLQKYGISSLQDLTKVDPSLNVQNYGAAAQKVIIRGVQSPIGSTTGIYLDETPLTGGTGGNILGDGKPGLRLLDIDHVEVLKGPQGTLFGAGSMSGTLRVITAKPDLNSLSGSLNVADASVHGNNYFEGSATVNVPIAKDVFGLRGTIWTEQGGGYIDQTLSTGRTLKNVNDSHVKGGRLIALWRPLDNLSLTGTAVRQEVDLDGTQAWQLPLGPYKNASPSLEKYSDTYELYSLQGEYGLSFGDITVNIGHTEQYKNDPHDSTPNAKAFGLTAITSLWPTVNYQSDTAEIRFSSKFDGPFQIVGGYFYLRDKSIYQTNAVTVDPLSGLPACTTYDDCTAKGLRRPGRGQSNYEFGTRNFRGTEQHALYAQADYKITDSLTATVGVRRYTADIRDLSINLQTVFPDFVFGNLTTPSVNSSGTAHNAKTSYNFSLMWQPDEDTTLYARAASGFRIGGVNSITSLAVQFGVNFPASYGPDSLWNYELGVKKYLFNRRLYLDAAIYQIDWKGQQLSATAPGAFAYTINAGKTTTKGFEINGTLTPIDGLSLAANVTYTDATLDTDLPADVLTAGTPGFAGQTIPYTSKWAGSARAEYSWPLSGAVTGYVQGSANYRGKAATAFDRSDKFYTVMPAYTLIDARIGGRFDQYDLSLFVRNLTDKAAVLGINAAIDGTRIFSPRPRTVGVQLQAKF